MIQRILFFLMLTSHFIGFGQNDTITYINEVSKKVRMVIMGDSLWLQNYESKKSIMIYLDYEALDVEGLAFYVGKLKPNDKELDVTVQFLDDSVCTIDSEISDFNFGLSKEEVKPKYSNNPFGREGSGVNGGVGNDAGLGGMGLDGNSSRRVRLNDPNIDHIETSVNCMITLKLTINENGEVVSASNVPSKTTTSDQKIISQVISVVRQQVKYKKSIDSGLQVVFLTVKLNAK